MIDYQDLEDRIASLERATRNIGLGQELVVGSLHALDKVTADKVVAADVIEKGPRFDIRAYGAVGDNSTDDTNAINSAIQSAYDNSEAGVVYVPPQGSGANDRYKITASLDWKGSVCFLGSGYYSRISAHVSDGAFPVIQSHSSIEQGVWMKGLTLGFEDYYDDADAKCIRFVDGDPYPRNWTIEDCTLARGYYGFYDETGGFMGHLRRVYAYQNRIGFHKSGGGTGHHFDTCFAHGKADSAWDIRGFEISSGVAYVFEACSMDGYDSPADGIAYFGGNYCLTINGFVLEANEAVDDGDCIVQFDHNYSVSVTGMKDTGCVVNADAADNTRLITAYKERIHFDACELGAGTTVNAGAGAEGYAIDITGTTGDVSRVTFTASSIANPTAGTNTPAVYAVRLGTAVNTCEVTLDNVLEGTILNANDNVVTRPRAGEGHITILPVSYDSIGQGTWPITLLSNYYLYGYVHNSSNDDGDNISFKVYLDAGTYTLLLVATTYSTAGIIDIYLDATEIASFDLYTSGTVYNVRKIDTGNVVGTAGLKTLKCQIDGKHASSSAHIAQIVYIALWRTA